MNTKRLIQLGVLLIANIYACVGARADCTQNPDQPTIAVNGASQAADQDHYYVVWLPDTADAGPIHLTITADGMTPCPTDDEKCICDSNSQDAEEDGDPSYSIDNDAGDQQPNSDGSDGPVITWDVDSSTAPGEYTFQVQQIEQRYRPCPSGYSGGVDGNSKTNDQASEVVTVLLCQLNSSTDADDVDDHQRSDIGIGEEVSLEVDGIDNIEWQVDGDATLTDDSGSGSDSRVNTNSAIVQSDDPSSSGSSNKKLKAGGSSSTIVVTADAHGVQKTKNYGSYFPASVTGTKNTRMCSGGTGSLLVTLVCDLTFNPPSGKTVSYTYLNYRETGEAPDMSKTADGSFFKLYYNDPKHPEHQTNLAHNPPGFARVQPGSKARDSASVSTNAGIFNQTTYNNTPSHLEYTIPIQFSIVGDLTNAVYQADWTVTQSTDLLNASGVCKEHKYDPVQTYP